MALLSATPHISQAQTAGLTAFVLVSLCALSLAALAGTTLVLAPPAYADDPPTAPETAQAADSPPPPDNAAPSPDSAAKTEGTKESRDGDDRTTFLPDPRVWAAQVFNEVLTNLLKTMSDGLRAAVDGAMASSLNYITQTPPAGSYASPTVQTLWNAVRLIANAALVLAALWGGFNLILQEHLGAPYHEAMELLPRLALGALLANTSLSWGQLAIDANNALCQAVGQTSLPAWQQAGAGVQLLVDVVATLIYLVTSLLLLLQMLMRLALIDVLLVASPLALLCWVLPQTHGWARLWSATFFGTVFTQFVQVLALKLGGSLLTELTPLGGDSALLAVFLGVAVLALTLKIPGLMRAHTGDGLGFVRYYLYRRGASMLEGRNGGSRGAGR